MAAARPLRAHDRGLTPVVALLGLAAVAWALTADRMTGMDMGPGTDPGGLGWFVVTWTLMTGSMMLPALVPALVPARGRGRAGGGDAAFAGGYLAVWTGVGVAAYALVEAVRRADPAWLAWDSGGRWIAAGAILGAAAYQLSAAKGAFLDRCRIGSTGAGAPGAGPLRDGVRHGAACVGCCAGLMAVLFVLGVMSLTWMVAVTALIAAERLLPWRTPAVYGVALVLAVLALWIAVDPASLPGLTLPAAPMPMGGM
jgi:predicted metal-binding membrane protein